jgi:hypothetical protein
VPRARYHAARHHHSSLVEEATTSSNDPRPSSVGRAGGRCRLEHLIIRLIIQTIRRDPSGAVRIDEAPNLSRADPSGADQIDAEHQATDLAVGSWSLARKPVPIRRCTKRADRSGRQPWAWRGGAAGAWSRRACCWLRPWRGAPVRGRLRPGWLRLGRGWSGSPRVGDADHRAGGRRGDSKSRGSGSSRFSHGVPSARSMAYQPAWAELQTDRALDAPHQQDFSPLPSSLVGSGRYAPLDVAFRPRPRLFSQRPREQREVP